MYIGTYFVSYFSSLYKYNSYSWVILCPLYVFLFCSVMTDTLLLLLLLLMLLVLLLLLLVLLVPLLMLLLLLLLLLGKHTRY